VSNYTATIQDSMVASTEFETTGLCTYPTWVWSPGKTCCTHGLVWASLASRNLPRLLTLRPRTVCGCVFVEEMGNHQGFGD